MRQVWELLALTAAALVLSRAIENVAQLHALAVPRRALADLARSLGGRRGWHALLRVGPRLDFAIDGLPARASIVHVAGGAPLFLCRVRGLHQLAVGALGHVSVPAPATCRAHAGVLVYRERVAARAADATWILARLGHVRRALRSVAATQDANGALTPDAASGIPPAPR